MATQIQLRRDTAANWTANNPTLAAGEFGWESDTNRFKIGTGASAWNDLVYASEGDTAGITFVGDDSTGTTVNQNETFKITGTQNITAVVSGDTLTLTGPDISGLAQSSSLATVATSGDYVDLSNTPTIPTNNNELTNGAGYITASSTDTLTNKSGNISQFTNDSGYKTSVSEADVTQHQAALSITESQISDLTHFSGDYTDLTNKPTIPSAVSDLTNDSGFISNSQTTIVGDDSTGTTLNSGETFKIAGTQNVSTAVSGDTLTITGPDLSSYATTSYVDQEVAGLVDTAPEALNTLNELAAALGDDANFATTTSTALGNRLRVDTNAQGLSTEQKTNAKTNLGLSTVASTGAYSDLSGTPTIPTNNNELTNGAGYITASSTDTLTNKSGNISQFTNDSGYLTSFTETNDLSSAVTWANVPDANITESSVTQHQAALSITESQISDLGSYITDANITIVGDDSTGTSFSAKNNDNIKITGTQNLSVAVSGDTITVTGPDLSSYSTFSGSYTDLTNKPTIPTNNNELTNGAGYITASSTDTLTNKSGNISQWTNDAGYKTSVSQSDVTQHQAALSITESQISDLTHFSGSYTDLTNKPTIPTNNNELTNGAGYITDANITIVGDDSTGTSFSAKNNDNIKITGTQNATVSVVGDTITVTGPDLSSYASTSYVDTQIANTVDSAPETLNTLNELAAALGDDANFATTTSTALGNRLRIDTAAQGLTSTQKSNATTNLGLATVASTGAYSDLTGTPTIPTNNNQLTNGAGYITGYTVTEGDVTAHQAALSITESQISDLGSYITASSTDTLTNKSGNISQWTNDSGYSTFSGSYTDLTNKPTIPTNNNELTNGAGYITASSTDTLTNKSGNISQWTNDSGYITGVSFAEVTGKPTTISGYGITDAFDGAYSSLTGTPSIPSALTDLGISDGTNGQVLTTDGAGNFTFTTVSGGGGGTGLTFVGDDSTGTLISDGETIKIAGGTGITTAMSGDTLTITAAGGGAANTGDISFVGSTMTSPSNGDMFIDASGTGFIGLGLRKPLNEEIQDGTNSFYSIGNDSRQDRGVVRSYRTTVDPSTQTSSSQREYANVDHFDLTLTGSTGSSSSNRFRMYRAGNIDLAGVGSTATSSFNSRGLIPTYTDLTVSNSSATGATIGNATGTVSAINVTNTTGDVTVTDLSNFNAYAEIRPDSGTTATIDDYNSYYTTGPTTGNSGTSVINNFYAFHDAAVSSSGIDATSNYYSFVTAHDKARAKPGALEKFNEYAYEATHSSGAGYTVDFNNGNLQAVTLTSNITSFTMSNFPTDSKHSVGVTLYLIQDGTGSRTMTFSAGSGETFKFSNGVNSSSVSAANDIQVIYIFSRYNGSSNTYYWTIGPAYS